MSLSIHLSEMHRKGRKAKPSNKIDKAVIRLNIALPAAQARHARHPVHYPKYSYLQPLQHTIGVHPRETSLGDVFDGAAAGQLHAAAEFGVHGLEHQFHARFTVVLELWE